MNQGEAAETSTTLDPNYVEKHQVVDEVHISSYYTANPAVASWSTHGENGNLSNPSYHHDQRVEPSSRNVQDGMNVASIASTSNSGVANVAQGYSGYATYPNTDPYGYNSSGYAGYYRDYQQQSNQYQQQSNQYQQQSNQYQQQSNQCQQQSDQPYPQSIGAYQNTGPTYQPLSSFQNTGSYTGPASYSSTYYNPGDYQTSGSYTSGTYGAQTNLWHGGQYAEYSSNQYPSYKPETNAAYSSTTAVATSQYQQHYKQWSEYYNQSQTDVSCAPGTENLSISSASNLTCSVPSASGVYSVSNYQLPALYTPSWRQESSSSESTTLQPGIVSGSIHEGYWKPGTLALQDNYSNSQPLHVEKPLDANPTYGSFQNQQQSTFSHGSSMQYPASHPVSQSSFQPVSQPLDSRRVNKLQIPTNPRIASNLALGLPKTDKESTTASTDSKPAYVSVSMPKPNEKASSSDAADSMLKPGVFPNSLRGYVERVFARCKDDFQKAACQATMKEVITKATAEGTLYTRDWDTEPLFPLPDANAVNKEDAHFFAPISSSPKNKRSPTRRAKSRWEPIPKEKVVEKSVNLSYETVKYGGRNTQFSAGKTENKENTLSAKFSFPEQKTQNKNATRPAKRQCLSNGLSAADDGETSSDSDKEQSLTAYYSAAVALADSPEEKKRRENRSKRFEKGRGNRPENNQSKAKKLGASNFYARRASAIELGKNFEEKGSRAVEDIDRDALTVKGTCQEIEKSYLRLTSAPDPATVRPEEVLEKALLMVQNSQKNYLYKCDQLKSIRQDLTVQHIRNELTVKVYETHARLAIEAGDLPEYNQCQSQLRTLYLEGIKGCHMEFAAYNLLCVLLHSSNNRDLLSAMSRLSAEAKKDEAVKHALSVRAAMTSGNYVMFFRLYKTAPNLNSCLMDLYAEKMRYAAIRCISRSYRPTVPVSYIAQILGFANLLLTTEASDEKDVGGVVECVEWLKAHGGCLTSDNSEEMLLDTKASVSSLYMPEPEDAVAHGDASLAVNDFLTRSLV